MSSEPLVSVIIPTFRELECLKLTLPAFLQEPRCEVVVGLDGDNPGFRRELSGFPATLSWTSRRQGACTATNLAAIQARGQYLLLCNDDMVPAPGWLDAMLKLAGQDTIVSGTCWEPGLVPTPPPHRVRDFGHHPESFKIEEFFEQAAGEKPGSELGINYPFLIPKELWDRVGGLDVRFEPGSASDPDLFIRLALLEPRPAMVRARDAVFYHFASRSSIFAGGRLSFGWKLHRRHGRAMFRHKWGRMWGHRFGDVPEVESWRSIVPCPEPALRGKLWRRMWFGNAGEHRVVRQAGNRAGPASGKRIAIFVWGGLGNAVMALPMINALRAARGDGNVILYLPKEELKCLVHGAERLGAILTHRKMLSKPHRADISLPSLPYPRWRYGLAALSLGARTRLGEAGLANPLLNRMVATKQRGRHWVERNLAMLEDLGIAGAEVKFGIPVDDTARKAAVGFLDHSGLGVNDKPVGLHPGSGNRMRRWPEEKFVGLGAALAAQGRRILVFGGPGEEELAERVASGIGSGAAAICGGLPEALALISLCRSFVAADSGLAHCAAALGVPVLAIIGPSDENVYRPYGPGVKVLTGRAECRPCYRPGKAIRCRHGRRSCLDVGVEEALEALRGLG